MQNGSRSRSRFAYNMVRRHGDAIARHGRCNMSKFNRFFNLSERLQWTAIDTCRVLGWMLPKLTCAGWKSDYRCVFLFVVCSLSPPTTTNSRTHAHRTPRTPGHDHLHYLYKRNPVTHIILAAVQALWLAERTGHRSILADHVPKDMKNRFC